MKGDFTRLTFAPEKHYSSVRMQQGRVQLDADWNEQLDIAAHRVEAETVDVVGTSGAAGNGFKVALQSSALVISAGRYYVDGILCENDQSCLVIGPAQPGLPVQPDAPNVAAPGPGGYLVYLDVWQRHLTAVDDPSILESALDAQTATRTKTVWQAKLLPVSEDLTGEFPCGQNFGEWTALTTPRSARMQARAQPDPSGTGPCVVPATAGYQRLENQLYRVEIHRGGPAGPAAGAATFKWSRDNGSVVSGVDGIDPAAHTITIRDPGRDAYLSFSAGQWVEITNDTVELNPDAGPGILVRLTTPTEGTLLTYDPTTIIGPAIDANTFKPTTRVRRWDADSGVVTTDLTNWIPLEGGVQVRFTDGDTYATGDYWLIPARAVTALSATGTIEWPQEGGGPALRQRAGIRHHYSLLGTLLVAAGNLQSVTDCRRVFPPLTAMTSLYYAGGDGQEAMPDYTQPTTTLLPALPEPLRAGVTNGDLPVMGATVRFAVVAGGGSLLPPPPALGPAPTIDVRTGSDGIASCTWQLTNNTGLSVQAVRATLLDGTGAAISTPIWYGATLSVATQVAIDPRNCTKLAPAKTVQDAIDKLCQQKYLVLRYLGGDAQEGAVNQTLPCPLSVGVEDETGKPRPDVQVTFDALSAGDLMLVPGTALVGTSVVAITNPSGVAQVNWTLGAGAQSVCHRVDAHLQSPPPQGTALPIHFNATIEQRAQGAFPVVKKITWFNDRPLTLSSLEKDGLTVTISTAMDPDTVNPSTFIVTAEVPESITQFGVQLPFRRSISVAGAVKVVDAPTNTMFRFDPVPSLPPALVRGWLDEQNAFFGPNLAGPGIRCRVVLKGNFISDGREGPPLDGNIFGVPRKNAAGVPFLDLDFNAPGDGIKGGDFESWFWLVAG